MSDEQIKIQENAEIQDALREFELKSRAEQARTAPVVAKEAETGGMVEFVIKHSGGLIKEQKQAEYLLLGFVIVVIAISFFLFSNAFRTPSAPPADQIINVA